MPATTTRSICVLHSVALACLIIASIVSFTEGFATCSHNAIRRVDSSCYMGLTVADLSSMSVKQALREVCGPIPTADSNDKRSWMASKLFPNVKIDRSAPSVCKFVIANPQAFLQNRKVASLYGVEVDQIPPTTPLEDLAKVLPVIYIADIHPEYGTLGLMLNQRGENEVLLGEVNPAMRCFRNRPVYLGGVQKQGSAFTMVHKRPGFPENRAWKGQPGNTDFKFFFSPDVAMANELVMTKDAKVTEFKFFQYTTIWQPRQLDLEYERKFWLTIEGPSQIFFEDDDPAFPLWRRVVASLPGQTLGIASVSSTTTTSTTTSTASSSSSSSTASDASQS